MAGSTNSIVARNVLRGRLSEDNLMAGAVGTAYNPTYAIVTEAGAQIVLYINSSNYQFYAELKDKYGNHISNSNIIDLPLESMVVDGSYDAETKEVVLILDNGNEVRFSVADLVEGLVSTEQLNTILTGYVQFTDYATSSKGGVIKTSITSGTTISDNGYLQASTRSYSDYLTDENALLVGKGTLENVITGKELTNKTYVDNADAVFEEDLFGNETVSGSGETITLNKTAERKSLDIDLKGNTQQNGTPTPDSSQDIHVGSGDNTIDICGKNLSPQSVATTTATGNMNASTTGYFGYVEAGTQYTMSFIVDSSNENTGYTHVRTYSATSGGTNLGDAFAFNRTIGGGFFSKTFTAPYTGYLSFSGSDMPPSFDFFTNVQLEKGNQATNFIPYQSASYPINLPEGMELCKIGDYQDRIFHAIEGDSFYDTLDSATKQTLTSGGWYKYGAIDKVIYNGSEDWGWANNVFYRANNKGLQQSIIKIVKSNYFTEAYSQASTNNANSYNPQNSICGSSSSTNRIYIKTNIASTTEDFKAWLSTHNTTVYYVLKTPINTEITDSTLLSQLNALKDAKSYDEQTNISQVNNDMPFELAATAFVDSTAGKLAAASAQINTLNEVDNNLNNTKEDKSNKVATISASSTDTEYPTAKCVYDIVGDVESLLEALDIGSGV